MCKKEIKRSPSRPEVLYHSRPSSLQSVTSSLSPLDPSPVLQPHTLTAVGRRKKTSLNANSLPSKPLFFPFNRGNFRDRRTFPCFAILLWGRPLMISPPPPHPYVPLCHSVRICNSVRGAFIQSPTESGRCRAQLRLGRWWMQRASDRFAFAFTCVHPVRPSG